MPSAMADFSWRQKARGFPRRDTSPERRPNSSGNQHRAGFLLPAEKLPPGITLDQAEKVLLAQAKNELNKKFREWELKSITIILKVEKGNVTGFRVKTFRGKECREEALKKIFEKISFPISLTGTLELNLECI